MLSYDSLLSHSQERGLPPGKLRGALREYVQLLALKALYSQPQAKALAFLGGTALRLGFNLFRFSEDLDFDAQDLSLKEWKALWDQAAHILSREGLKVQPSCVEKGRLLLGDLRCEGLLQKYRLTPLANEKLRIKVESNRPSYDVEREPRVLSGYGELFPVSFASSSIIAAEKIEALLHRELGRDVYDLFFIAGKRWNPDPGVLSVKDPAAAILARVSGWGSKRLKEMARRLEPFLFDPDQARLVAAADQLLPSALEYLKA
ncbi:MAG: nucleotidyl transferase AbiEii/AbiGii toxin family protein [Elusimicrobia bacterium]|nr:nucleotidyl transferase AbiEii/AbiGii toxin family protein [Elusimicrobiota bacterium]